jgi:hypothetical protein
MKEEVGFVVSWMGHYNTTNYILTLLIPSRFGVVKRESAEISAFSSHLCITAPSPASTLPLEQYASRRLAIRRDRCIRYRCGSVPEPMGRRVSQTSCRWRL